MKQSKRERAILEEFDRLEGEHERYCAKLKALVSDLLSERGIRTHSVDARLKDRDSLRRKITGHDKYGSLEEVTDITGIRIITYFADDVDRAGEVIEEEFVIDEENSIDRRELLNPESFGYLSLHYVVKLTGARTQLAEYHRYGSLCAEIQIRSILQHAWAEIEHDLGYKTPTGVPREARRQFSRLAGLLEIADNEFMNIRSALVRYERDLPGRIETTPTEVLIDNASLKQFLRVSPAARRVGSILSEMLGADLSEPEDDVVSLHTDRFKLLGIDSIGKLEPVLSSNVDSIERFARAWLDELGTHGFAAGTVALLYLEYVLVGKSGDRELARRVFGPGRTRSERDSTPLADRIIETAQRIL